MAFSKTAKANGDSVTYELSDQVKRYSLKDVGFTETKQGNYSLERSLDPGSPFNATYKVKVMVKKDLTGFRMSVTTGNGLKPVNIFANDDTAENVEQFRFVMQNLVDRDILKPNHE
ncbi:DUF1831 domain-containing protein [Lentilactobacillus sp. Marseille-Q4993]|uniref:DUF1831 domain-containing protein n=1 Tax=Lentilactobacillus sp. Marseille-Q4993 TaxID=3039492 RepID=UPI0024BC278A|nr:DUF1831 domain-containing protein [Lentilactobacillus sp. Marseille-Q4993]